MTLSGWTVPGYTETGILGAGATGRVVSAVQDATGMEVAIKYLAPRYAEDPEFVERFRDEAALLAEIDHPNVVRLYEYVESEHGSAMVMELVQGPTLHRVLHENGRMTPEAALTVMRGSLLGLGTAHQLGIVHRDYKPSNVLLNVYGVSKLADFGVAERAVLTDPEDPDATMPGGTGTPAYMAPEQWDGAPARPVTDIYAVTASFFECLTGRVPFSADTIYDLQEKHRTAPIPLAEVPAEVQALITHGLAKDPSERPQDVGAFVAEVEHTAADLYGVDWEERGRREIVVALWPILPLLGFNLGGLSGAADGLEVLGLGERNEPGNLQTESGGPSGGGEGSEGNWFRRMPRKAKAGSVAAGVAAAFLIVAAVAFAGSPKNSPKATPPTGSTSVFTPTPDSPTGTSTSSDAAAAAATSSGSSSSSSSSSSSGSSSSSSSSSGFSAPSGPSQPSSKPSTSHASVPPPSTPPASSPSSPPSTSVPSSPSSTPSPPPASVNARMPQPKVGNCQANYSVTFVIGQSASGFATVDYTWHLANGTSVDEGPVTMKTGTSQYSYIEDERGTTTGDVYVSWTSGGVSGQTSKYSVTITCLT